MRIKDGGLGEVGAHRCCQEVLIDPLYSDNLEREPWSDFLGKSKLTKESFTLPGNDWEWDGDWKLTINNSTDSEGWEYAADFKSNFKPESSSFAYVRRRKWSRKCSQWNRS